VRDEISSADRLRERLKTSLKVAVKARDTIAIAAIRSALGAIDNAEAVDPSPHAPGPTRGRIATARLGVGVGDVARRELSAQEVIEILRAEVSDRYAAAEEYEGLGRTQEASRLRADTAIFASHLDDLMRDS
jgi:uncharacterized protein YqeY